MIIFLPRSGKFGLTHIVFCANGVWKGVFSVYS